MHPTFQILCPTAADTQSLAEKIGAVLRGGEVIEFASDLGGGKTTFVKGLARGMGVTDIIQSPTFTISQVHKAARGLELHHFDFYRLDHPGVMRAELAESLTQPNAVVALEWGEIVHDVLPAHRLTITISVQNNNSRVLGFTIPKNYEAIRELLSRYEHQGRTA